MSSPKVKSQSVEGIGKSDRETGRCNIPRRPRVPSTARSPSTSGQESKIPTNISHIGRSSVPMLPQVQDSRILISVASEEATLGSPMNSVRRPTSKNASSAVISPVVSKMKSPTVSVGNSAMLKRQLDSQFATKKKRYVTLKKELTDKQKQAVDLYEEISELREKLLASGAKDPGKIETINLMGIPPQRCSLESSMDTRKFLCSEQMYAPNPNVTRDLVSSIETKIRQVPSRYFDVCKDALQKLSKLLEFLTDFDKNNETSIDPEISKQIQIYRAFSEGLEKRLEDTKKCEEEAISQIIPMVSSLWNEVEVSCARIHELETKGEEIICYLRDKIDAAVKEKKCDTEKFEQLKEHKVALEAEHQKVKTKIRGMETRANEDERRITELKSTIKDLENQVQRKESSTELRLKELQKSLKNSENLLAKTEKQRDSFETKFNEMKTSFGSKEVEAENKIKELTEKLKTVSDELQKEREERKIMETENTGDCTMEQAIMKIQLKERDEKIAKLEREKKEIILLIDEESGHGLKGEVIEHERVLKTLTKTLHDLQINIKLTREKNETLQKELVQYRGRVQAQTKDSAKSQWSGRAMDLQRQVADLRCNVTELKKRNEELEILLNQKQLENEAKDRAIREECNAFKIRDQVTGLLKGKSDLRSNVEIKRKNQRDRDQVDKQIAEKAENLQQLYSTLEAKQMQITRLEQLVKDMEIQQDRAQEQRTRLEKKIAQYQMAMHFRGKSHRYVKIDRSDESAKVSSAPLHETSPDPAIVNPRSFSRPPLPRSPVRQHPPMQRSKTLNSFKVTGRALTPTIEYASQVMNEVARTLKRERVHDYRNRGAKEERKYSRNDRGTAYAEENVLDDLDISKNEIQESFYNWLFEPGMFEGETSKLARVSNPQWPIDYTPHSAIDVNVSLEDRSPRRHRPLNDCSRETRCGSPGCRRQSAPDWNCSARPTRVRTSPRENIAARSRRQRS